MATMEMRRQNLTDPDLSDLARDLSVIATRVSEGSSVVKELSRGFLGLSTAARSQGKIKIGMASRALASILDGLDRGPESDAPFILDTALNFLDTLATPTGWRANGANP